MTVRWVGVAAIGLAAAVLSVMAGASVARAQDCVPSGPEVCDGLDNDCDLSFDEDTPGSGQRCDTAQSGICADGLTSCIGGVQICSRVNDPVAELCDGIDNDCDGEVDDGNPEGRRPCETDEPGDCRAGLTRCLAGAVLCVRRSEPGPEQCDARDNNCDGNTDEGNPGGGVACNTNEVGTCAEGRTRCVAGGLLCIRTVDPGIELCDNVDNDCDGSVDEGNPGENAGCVVDGAVGQCGVGLTRCTEGGLRCNPLVLPGAEIEICDGLDNDCDGLFDEQVQSPQPGVIPEVGDACDAGCGPGQIICSLGRLRCDGPSTGQPESCNGADDDCDGVVDETAPGQGDDCATGLDGVCGTGTTRCLEGRLQCVGVFALDVQRNAPELCDGEDNNCDGNFDEGNPGGGFECLTAQLGVCAAGRTACANAQTICRAVRQASPEVCDGLDNNCNGQADEQNPGGGVPCETGDAGVCAEGVLNCRESALACDALNIASDEICDGLDNDCDGTIDEENPGGGEPCDTGARGVCAQGARTCVDGALACVQTQRPADEACDGRDNDCDGQVDEADPRVDRPCQTGRPGACAPGINRCQGGLLVCQPEAQPAGQDQCDGVDEDCDGMVDEGNPGGGIGCAVEGAQGLCSLGETLCVEGGLICGGNPRPTAESCDSRDNDCDGAVDEGNPDGGAECPTGLPGACATGLEICQDGALTCSQTVDPATEACDGIDNDCDGAVDEGDFTTEMPCATGGTGPCALGHLECIDGALACIDDGEPGVESCNEVDDDCDGLVDEGFLNDCGLCGELGCETCNAVDDDCDGDTDEGVLCEAEQVCVRGHCVDRCAGNECTAADEICVQGGCLEPCEAVDCPSGWACDAGRCQDPCVGVRCGAGEACALGECVGDSCYEAGCAAAGEVCLGGQCIPDPCGQVDCDDGMFCRPVGDPPQGECQPSCATVSCPFDHACRGGVCVPDACFGVACPEGEGCSDGVCERDRCVGVPCGTGRACVRGSCVDEPCNDVRCPVGQRCVADTGSAECAPDWLAQAQPPMECPEQPDAGPDAALPPDAGTDQGPPPDQGVDATVDGTDMTANPDAGAGDGGGGGDGSSGGCDCEASPASDHAPLPLLLLGFAVLARPRRRR